MNLKSYMMKQQQVAEKYFDNHQTKHCFKPHTLFQIPRLLLEAAASSGISRISTHQRSKKDPAGDRKVAP